MKQLKVADFFCGGGGSTTGMRRVQGVKVVAALNHDANAIHCHETNHPETQHFYADIREQNENEMPKVDIGWFSLECTNYSNAKGGAPRDADSRTLAWEVPRFAIAMNMKYIIIENVREFMSWGPLDQNGRPVNRLAGRDYLKWVAHLQSIGFVNYQHKILNTADFGGHTSRKRYFGIFSRKGCPISWPQQTHCKGKDNMFGMQQWQPCKPLLNLNDEGTSIFGRKKPLAESTLKRIAFGIVKYCLNNAFIMKYYGNGENVSDVNEPLHTITTKDRHALIQVEKDNFITQHIHGVLNAQDINRPLNTILTKDLKQLITVSKKQFVADSTYGNKKVKDINEPLNTLTTQQRHQLITISTEKKQFIHKYFNAACNVSSINSPLGTITTTNKNYLVTALLNSNWLIDVKMRFLHVDELKRITGFPEDYQLTGTKRDQIKMIGNAVTPVMSQVLLQAIIDTLNNQKLAA